MNTSDTEFYKINQLQIELTHDRYLHWLQFEVFNLRWWLVIGVWLGFVFVLWKFIDKKRLIEILLYGAVLAYLTTVLDATGAELGVWSYQYKEIPLFNRLMIADTTIIPVSYMLLYQYFRTWKSFLAAHVILAALFAFGGEPILEWLKIYHPNGWKHIYSFPIYILLGLFMKWLIEKLKNLQERY